MTPSYLRSTIANYFDRLHQLGIARFYKPVTVDRRQRGFSISSKPTHDIGGETAPFGSIAEYLSAARRGDFSCILADCSLIQVSYLMINRELVQHRLAYLPCPCRVDKELFEELDLVDAVEVSCAEPRDIILRTPVRFDFDIGQTAYDHPKSHLHMNSGDCRCPVARPLLPAEFLRFILRNFYPASWAASSSLHERNRTRTPLLLSPDEQREIHLSWISH